MGKLANSARRLAGTFLVLGLAWGAEADPLLVRSRTTSFGYGASNWQTMTGFINQAAGNEVTVTGSIADLDSVMGFSALWVDLDLNNSQRLSAAELQNISAFAATGRRVVLFGENQANWAGWDADLLSFVGGTNGGSEVPYAEDISLPVLQHFLTTGVQSTFSMGDGLAIGGTPLFDQNFATLWEPRGNVLTVLSVDLLTDDGVNRASNRRFGQNIAMWAMSADATPVPEPATVVLVGSAALAAILRRKKRTL